MLPAINNRVLIYILAAVTFIVLLLGGTYFYLTNSQNLSPFQNSLREALNLPGASPSQRLSEPEPTPRPIKPLPSGVQTYNISHGAEVKGPKPFRAIVSPLTPKKGEKQSIQLAITSDAEITEAKIILHTDNNKKEYPLKLIDGNTQNGTWEASWTMDDSYDYNYYIQFYLKSANGLFQNGLRLRQ